MTIATPQEKASDLFNKLAHLHLEDIGAAQEFANQLLLLNRQQPGDVITKIALAEALLLTGQRQEAINQIGGAYSLRRHAAYAALDRLALLHFFVSDMDRAIEVIEEYAFEPGLFTDGILHDNAAQIAAWAANFDLLHRLANRVVSGHLDGASNYFLRAIERVEKKDSLVRHQKIVASIMKESQVAATFGPSTDADGEWILINTLFFDASIANRRDLEQRLGNAVEVSVGTELEGIVTNIVTASPGKPAVKASFLRPVT